MLRDLVRRLLAAVLALALVVLIAPRRARAEDPPNVVILVEGGDGAKLASALGHALPSPWRRGDSGAFNKAAKVRGVKSHKPLDVAKTKAPHVDKLARSAGAANANAVLLVRVGGTKNARSAKVLLVTASGTSAVDTKVSLDAPANDVTTLSALIRPELLRLSPASPAATAVTPVAPPPSTTAPPEPSREPARVPPPSDARVDRSHPAPDTAAVAAPPAEPAESYLPLLDAAVALELASRHFSYKDAITPNRRPYDVDGTPTPAVRLELYPLARSGKSFLKDLGFVGALHAALGLESETPSGQRFSTTWSRVDLALRGRIRFSTKPTPAVLGLSVGYGRESFLFRDEGSPIRGELPSVSYSLIRPRLDLRIPAGPIAVTAAGAYLHVLDAGAFASRFRAPEVTGIDVELGVALPIKILELRAGVSYRRLWYGFDPEPGDAAVAGGALEQIIRPQVALAFVY